MKYARDGRCVGPHVETCIENFRRHAVQVHELVRDYPRRVRSDCGRVDADRPIGVVELGRWRRDSNSGQCSQGPQPLALEQRQRQQPGEIIRVERSVWANRPEELMQHLPRPRELPPGFELARPISDTFIPAKVFDNPALTLRIFRAEATAQWQDAVAASASRWPYRPRFAAAAANVSSAALPHRGGKHCPRLTTSIAPARLPAVAARSRCKSRCS